MNKQQKELSVSEIRKGFEESSATFLVGYKGLSVAETEDLRKKLRKEGGRFMVAKMRLVKRAAHGLENTEKMDSFFKNQLGVVFANQDPLAVAKTLHQFSKEKASLDLIAGCLGKQFLDKQAIARVATLPSREVLLAQLCGTLNAPITNFTVALKMILTQFVQVTKQISEKKSAAQ